MIQPNDRVKVVFKNGMVEDGFVMSWSQEESILRFYNSSNELIIPDTRGSVQAVKVFREPDQAAADDPDRQVYVDKPMEPEEYHRDENERIQSLVELRALAKKEEQARLHEHMNNFRPNADPGLTSYDYPSQPAKSVPVSAAGEDRRRPAGHPTLPLTGRRYPNR